jgi:hypothetical protein
MVCKDNSIDMQSLEALAKGSLESVHKLVFKQSVIPRLDQGIQCFRSRKLSRLDYPVKPDNDKTRFYGQTLISLKLSYG